MTERPEDDDLQPIEHVIGEDDAAEPEVTVEEPEGDDAAPVVEQEAPAPEAAPEPPAEAAEKVPESVQKRIDKLTWQMREMERAAKALAERNRMLEEVAQRSQSTTAQAYARDLNTRYEQAKAKKKAAFESGDSDALLAADEEMAGVLADRERFNAWKQQQDASATQARQQPQRQAPVQQQPDEKAVGWAQRNDWFGKDKIKTAAAYAIDAQLKNEGVDPRSDEYYSRLDQELRKAFPDLQGKPPASSMSATTVAPANRTVTPAGKKGRQVKLSESQVAIAKRLGVPLEVYAREVLKMERNA